MELNAEISGEVKVSFPQGNETKQLRLKRSIRIIKMIKQL